MDMGAYIYNILSHVVSTSEYGHEGDDEHNELYCYNTPLLCKSAARGWLK